MGGHGSGRRGDILKSILPPQSNVQFSAGEKSKGILDDYAERKNIDTMEGTIQKTPVNAKDIANKAYVDDILHDAVTVTDTATIDLTLTGQNIQADTIDGAIDHDALLNFLANEHIDWTSTTANFSTTGTVASGSNTVSGDLIVTGNISMSGELGAEFDAGDNTIGFTQQSQTGDGTTTIDWKLGNKDFHTFGSQNETFVFTAPTNPCNILLVLKQDSTGSRTVSWPAAVKWTGGTAPTLTTAANSIDIISFYYDGTSYYGVDSLNFS